MSAESIISIWVNEYSRELHSWAHYKTSSSEIAKDLVQDTFLAAFKNFGQFKGESEPKTWLFAILNNKIREYYRSKIRSTFFDIKEEAKSTELTMSLFDEDDSWIGISEKSDWDELNPLDNPEFIEILESCLEHLPEKWKIAVLMKYRLDTDTKEICQELDLSITNYWQVMHRAKLMLKKCIDLNW